MCEFIVTVLITGVIVEIAYGNFVTVHLEHMGITHLQCERKKWCDCRQRSWQLLLRASRWNRECWTAGDRGLKPPKWDFALGQLWWQNFGAWLEFGLEWFYELGMLARGSDVTEAVDCYENFKKGTLLLRHVSVYCWGSIFDHYRGLHFFACRSQSEKSQKSKGGWDLWIPWILLDAGGEGSRPLIQIFGISPENRVTGWQLTCLLITLAWKFWLVFIWILTP